MTYPRLDGAEDAYAGRLDDYRSEKHGEFPARAYRPLVRRPAGLSVAVVRHTDADGRSWRRTTARTRRPLSRRRRARARPGGQVPVAALRARDRGLRELTGLVLFDGGAASPTNGRATPRSRAHRPYHHCAADRALRKKSTPSPSKPAPSRARGSLPGDLSFALSALRPILWSAESRKLNPRLLHGRPGGGGGPGTTLDRGILDFRLLNFSLSVILMSIYVASNRNSGSPGRVGASRYRGRRAAAGYGSCPRPRVARARRAPMEGERPPAKRRLTSEAESGAPPPRARPWNAREDVTLALLAERGCFDGDTDETQLSVLASLPGRTVAECRERWTYFVCPMRYGVAARTPPSPWVARRRRRRRGRDRRPGRRRRTGRRRPGPRTPTTRCRRCRTARAPPTNS